MQFTALTRIWQQGLVRTFRTLAVPGTERANVLPRSTRCQQERLRDCSTQIFLSIY